MSFRVTLIMRWGRQSWGETHYDLNAASFPEVEARAPNLAVKRAALLGFDAFVVAARASDPANQGSSELIPFNPPIQGQKFNINVGFITSITSDNVGLANDAVMVDAGAVVGGHFHRSRPMLGAPPDGLIQSMDGVPSVRIDQCPQWGTNFNVFSTEMTTGNWGFRYTNEGTAYAIQAVLGGAGVPIGLVVPDAFSPAPQTLIHVRGLRVHPLTRVRIAGMWRVLATVGGPGAGQNTVTLSNSAVLPAGSSYLLPGTVQTAASAIIPYSRFAISTGATRKRGGSIDLPRGRSRTRV